MTSPHADILSSGRNPLIKRVRGLARREARRAEGVVLEVVDALPRDAGRRSARLGRGVACGVVGHRWSFPKPGSDDGRRRPAVARQEILTRR